LTGEMQKKYGITEKAAFYLCGPPPMMDFELEELKALGVDPASVEREKFSW
jgi:ferredoxin-NADP reductase